MSATRLQFINHSSVLIQKGSTFLLTDPWFQKPAFGSWLPQPPMFVHPAYLTALAKDAERFLILVSHGHDDHLDDELVSLFAGVAEVVIPEFKSPGLSRRLMRLGFSSDTITRVGANPVELGPFRLRAYFNEAFTHDDALLTVRTSDAMIVHANDNWRVHPRPTVEGIQKDGAGVDPQRWLYMSQCNAADGFPFNYPQFNEAEQNQASCNRVRTIMRSSLENALTIGARRFLQYAGHTLVFVRGNDRLRESSGPKSLELLGEVLDDLTPHAPLDLLDMRPGDTFDFDSVARWPGNVLIKDATLKESSLRFYKAYGAVDRCDTFKFTSALLTGDRRIDLARKFLADLDAFITRRVHANNYHPDVVGAGVLLGTPDRSVDEGVIIGRGSASIGDMSRWTRFDVSVEVLDRILIGAINAENLFIGGEATIFKSAPDYYNGGTTFWLSKFSYSYQHECAARPNESHPTDVVSRP